METGTDSELSMENKEMEIYKCIMKMNVLEESYDR